LCINCCVCVIFSNFQTTLISSAAVVLVPEDRMLTKVYKAL